MVVIDESLLTCFPPILRYSSVFALFSISGFWILATSCRSVHLQHNIALIMPKASEQKEESSSLTATTMTLVFFSTEELQTRLVLLPRIEEEGVGAVVDSFVSTENGECDNGNNEQSEKIRGAVVDAIVTNDEQERVDLKDKDFAEILATMRQAAPPIHLELLLEEVEDQDDKVDAASEREKQESSSPIRMEDPPKMVLPKEAVFEEEKKTDPADLVEETNDPEPVKVERTDDAGASVQQSLMSWASRFSATSVQLATERAQQAMEVASEKRKAAAAAMAVSMPSNILRNNATEAQASQNNNVPSRELDLDLFIQTSSGAFLPLPKEKQRLSSELRVTNSSVLTVRKSATEACAVQSYSFQWYRSMERKGSESSANNTNKNDGVDNVEWVELPGATSRTFQPTAIELGHKIKCLVTKLDGYDSEDNESSEMNESACSVSLETFECVSAALPLFNGARQALVNGAQFGSIKGEGNATGRTFRIKVAMLISKDPNTNKPRSTNSVCFYQVSGSTSEPIDPEEEPITGIAAVANHENAKGFELILPENLPESASMVKALATEDGRLQLSAPNRLSRESLLLSIGIANFTGQPSSLGPSSILFYDTEENYEDLASADGETESVETLENEVESATMESLERPPLIPKNTETMQRSISLDLTSQSDHTEAQRVKELERELNTLRSRLAKKDKTLGDMQKQVASCESANAKLVHDLSTKDGDLKETKKKLLVAERRMQSQEDDMKRMRSDHAKTTVSLNKELESRASKIADLEKTARNLQNEKAVLSATVEARDSKLAKMVEASERMQSSLNEMSLAVAKTDSLQNELDQASQNYSDLSDRFESLQIRDNECRSEIEEARKRIVFLEEKHEEDCKKVESCRTELDLQQMKIQKLKAERNSYKQKSDSLSKEIAKVCRQGRTIKEVEKIVFDDAARRQEVELLREQKRKALEDLNHYRTSFEQSRAAQRLAGVDQETTKIFERNVELERLLAELTEYVSAKEMQLETLKQVNETLQLEIKELHKAQMSKNLGKNDV